ncbi:preprotein translocase subunit SecG [Tenacibaculum maritimum]|uniref:preprotein translocase subunit SecG n=1 Tax=Tenacibaculum maritimum TaxID=107401 RepID=UPI001E3EC9F8|nr:preprotein translocase subunit SecG [Tenacibaculum maritimum]MCD9583901.1 preprotein translocase subunit SecG [Tenacibaculum maritimum]MCD9620541.1 preprotein translocase subunit SecG [Tenacibaculum maritimum]MCD9626612.1 preprotein translocase subunit SecG [Tenacibaculum maritimum]MCD9629326.1 preprotein translocase subunit SecG [Tenacibaculum maritimum]MCD9631979.1 preprotein translocase subunit SecG [Tenacibaculum maritimum]
MTAYTLVLILILIVAFALILIVMVQNPKGGGLSSSFGGGAQSLGGVQNTNNFLDKATWTLAITMFVLILLANFAIPRGNSSEVPSLENTLENVEKTTPVEAPAATTKDSVN